MKKRNYILAIALCALFTIPFISCSDDDDPSGEPTYTTSGLYILNSGNKGANNATLSFYNLEDGTVVSDIFKQKNNRGLGDTGQDILIYGNKMYISVTNSQTIEVTDLEGKSLKQIKATQKPRSLASHNGKVYVTLFDGYVGRVDTTSLEIDKTIQVGRNPEQIVVANNKLYVANSGGMDYNTEIGYDKTVSVIDIPSFTETKKLDVIMNPCNLAVDNQENVYLVSMGNYDNGNPPVPNTLQIINSKTDIISSTDIKNATELSSTGDKIYMYYSQYDKDWKQTITYYVYDAVNKKTVTDKFISDGTVVAQPYKIIANKDLKYVFITESNYTTNGDVNIFSEAGALVKKFEAGLNPVKVINVAY